MTSDVSIHDSQFRCAGPPELAGRANAAPEYPELLQDLHGQKGGWGWGCKLASLLALTAELWLLTLAADFGC